MEHDEGFRQVKGGSFVPALVSGWGGYEIRTRNAHTRFPSLSVGCGAECRAVHLRSWSAGHRHGADRLQVLLERP